MTEVLSLMLFLADDLLGANTARSIRHSGRCCGIGPLPSLLSQAQEGVELTDMRFFELMSLLLERGLVSCATRYC